MAQIEKRTGRTYRFFQYYGAKNPKYVVIAMGSVCETIREILPQMNCADTDCDTGSSGMQDDIMQDNSGIYGMIQVHLFRPFSAEDFLKELPESVERIAVLDRTKEPGATWRTAVSGYLRRALRKGKCTSGYRRAVWTWLKGYDTGADCRSL